MTGSNAPGLRLLTGTRTENLVSSSLSSPSGHPGLLRVPLLCSSLQYLLFDHQRRGGRLLFQLPKPPFCFPWDAGVSSPAPSQNQGATLLHS